MEEEEDDDIYAENDHANSIEHRGSASTLIHQQGVSSGSATVEEESGEEIEEDESDSDIDIITEKKDEPKAEPAQDARITTTKVQSTGRQPLTDAIQSQRDTPALKVESLSKEPISLRPGASYPAVKSSTVDVDAKPIHEASGKPITEVDMDADFGDDDKAWRRPGTDQTDFFNYGFDEFTWANYCLKQQSLREKNQSSKKEMEDLQTLLSSGVGNMPGMSNGTGGNMPSMPDMSDIPPAMQQMFGQMMGQGMDPSQMDPASFMQMMSGAQAGSGSDGPHGFGNQTYGQQHNQQGYGYGGGNQGGRGRGRRW